MLPALDLESIRCFESAATLLNFRAAAARVHLSPAAFGDRIRRLEEELGTPLFDRTTRKVDLTGAGRRLLPHARRLLSDARRCYDLAADETMETVRELWIGTRYELGLSWLVPNIPKLEAPGSRRKLHLSFGDSNELLRRLLAGQIDAFITSARLTAGDLDYVSLHEEKYVFVGSKKLLSKTKLGFAEDARKHVLVDAFRDLPLFRYFLDAVPAEELWAFDRIEYMGTIAAIKARVLDGAGVGVLPEYFVAPEIAKGRLIRIQPKRALQRDFFRLVFRRDHSEPEMLRALAADLQAIPLR